MERRRWRRLALLPAVAVVLALLFWAAHVFHQNLEAQARRLDMGMVLRRVGLEGRVFSFHWKSSTLQWLPRPALVLREVEASLSSGQPGPGAVSGQARLKVLRLVPGWSFLRRPVLERIEASQGLIEIHPDLLPPLPRTFVDPADGRSRPVPYAALLQMLGDSLAMVGANRPAARASSEGGALAQGHFEGPSVHFRNLEMRLASLEALPGTELRLQSGVLLVSPRELLLRGEFRAVGPGTPAQSIPLEIRRAAEGESSAAGWEVAVGRPGRGELRLTLRPPGEKPSGQAWSVTLVDPRGGLAEALLRDPAYDFARDLHWSGPWRLEATGAGPFPTGLQETQIDFLASRISMGDSLSRCSLLARGQVRIVPGRVDLPFLSLRQAGSLGDSALVRLEWLRTLHGQRMRGRLDGKIAPAWLAMAGTGWSAAGTVEADAAFEGSSEDNEAGWTFTPHGRIIGELDSLVTPWFGATLRQGRLQAWAESGRLHLLLVGRYGESPFRLEAQGLPPPGPGYLQLMAADAVWSFRSPWCRLEDFRLSPERFPNAGPTPFWLGLPGRGAIDIERGSVGGQPFGQLHALCQRTRGGLHLDSLSMQVAGGVIRAEPGSREEMEGVNRGGGGLDLSFEGVDLDMEMLEAILRAQGVSVPGEYRGRLSGSLRFRDGGGESPEWRWRIIEGSLHGSEGSVRGLSVLETLRRSTHLDAFSVLSFRDWRMEIRRDAAGFFWNRMRLDAPPLRVEGAGRVLAEDTLKAVLAVRLSPGGSDDPLASILQALLGPGQSTVYVLLQGRLQSPSVELLSRAAFLKELDDLGAKLLPG